MLPAIGSSKCGGSGAVGADKEDLLVARAHSLQVIRKLLYPISAALHGHNHYLAGNRAKTP